MAVQKCHQAIFIQGIENVHQKHPNWICNIVVILFWDSGTIIQDVTERCRQILGLSSTYQNSKKCPYQHVYENI
jgi:hypothetical protein